MATPDVRARLDAANTKGFAAPAAAPTTTSTVNTPAADDAATIDLGNYRRLVRTYIDMRRYKTALFWAEKVVALSAGTGESSVAAATDVYWLAQCMFLLREYHRAAHVIRVRGLERTSLHCLYLAAESLFEAKDSPQAIELLAVLEFAANPNANVTTTASAAKPPAENPAVLQPPADGSAGGSEAAFFGSRSELLASVWLLKGRVLESMDNRALAMDAYIQALQHSVHCTEALDALVQHEMLLVWEEQELIANLPVAAQCGAADAQLLLQLYRSKMKKYYETNFAFATAGNAEQTPLPTGPAGATAAGAAEFVKSMRELTDKMKREHCATAAGALAVDDPIGAVLSGQRRRTATPYKLRPNIMSPANKILMDLKTTTPNYSIQSSLSRTSFSALGDSLKSTPSAAAAAAAAASGTTAAPPQSPLLPPLAAATAAGPPMFARQPIRLQLATKLLDEQSVDLMVARAERLFYNSEYKKCMALLDDCFLADPYHAGGLTVQIGCLVELKESNKLFYLAHNLIDLYPEQAISWYAVGCYYDLNGKCDPARRYLSKATALDRLFGPAWLAYGHSFAKENEHDQAMAAYFKATQLMRGCHLPLLYIGVECGLTNNRELAEKFFYQAMSVAPLDVFVLHELGVIKFEFEDYESAEDILRDTLEMVCKIGKQQGERSLSARWEPLFNNLGHCCRKNGKYAEALRLHQRALALNPMSAGTYTAIAFVQSLMGRLEDAIESLHRSLSLKRDDIFATTLLRYCIEDLTEEDAIPDGLQLDALDRAMDPASENQLDGGGGDDVAMMDDTADTQAGKKGAGATTGAAPAALAQQPANASETSTSSSSGSSAEVRTKLKFDDTVASAGAMDSSLDMSM